MALSFSLSPEQEEFRKVVRRFADEVIAPAADEMNAQARFPVEIVRQMGGLGLFGIPFSSKYDGMDGDYLTLCLAIEELGRVDQSMGITLEAGVGLGAAPIDEFGTDEQKQRWLPELCRGEKLGGFGLTEPGGGSDVFGATRTRAVQDGDSWVINGGKVFITNSGTEMTSIVTVTAFTGEDEMTSIVVPVDTPGFSVAPPYRKVGWHASDTRELILEDVRVPVANTLGERGAGFRQFLKTLDDGRIAISALAVGLIQGCVDECVRYAQEREAFGKPIAKQQALAFKIADLEVAAQTARQMYYLACWRKMEGLPYKREASISKLFSSEQAVTAAREATQVFGGYGFTTEYRVGRFYQDAKILEIGEGTSEVQRMLIARSLGL
ncbi:acyl-CoA dehydrogenase [Egicoccus halophilus]|uniref:Acyl-CoA dehydrogenase n=1 Tax=Egicoccus halophilus TaxID=1670830 RepID=A0A8J3A649_9ACTN|nr:acyl-CoA dehydrogenase family protein [Egicoccus halophilus]GGI03875.1 acyl-CoA dehydrogenase [Egicoccus halophilus]